MPSIPPRVNIKTKIIIFLYRRLISWLPKVQWLKICYARLLPSIQNDEFARRHGIVELLSFLGLLETSQPVCQEFIISRFRSKATKYESIVTNAGYLSNELELCSAQVFKLYKQLKTDSLRLLDLGCGTGLIAKTLVDKGFIGMIDGVDLSPEMLAEASKKYLYRRLVASDAITFVTGENAICSYNIIVACSVVPFFPPDQLEELIIAVSLALKSGGFFVFTFDTCSFGYQVNKKLFCEHSIALIRDISLKHFTNATISEIDFSRVEAGSTVRGAICICS